LKPEPYYQDATHTIYHGDCREILPFLSEGETIITDPVWPNAGVDMTGREDPEGLFRGMCEALSPGTFERLVVHLGCDSDPRFLRAIPPEWGFLRVCWLDYAMPSHKGRLLYSGDVGYIYGVPPAYIKGRQLMSGMCRSTMADKMFVRGKKSTHNGSFEKPSLRYAGLLHPCPRRLQHVEWLTLQFSDEAVCDPFMGSGTTGVAAKKWGRRFVGIEIEEEYCALAVGRIKRQQLAKQKRMIFEEEEQ